MMFPKPPKRGKGSIPLKTRLLVLERDRFCQRCGAGRGLEPHHILPKSRGGTHDARNIVCLCPHCHRWTHANPEEAREQGFTR